MECENVRLAAVMLFCFLYTLLVIIVTAKVIHLVNEDERCRKDMEEVLNEPIDWTTFEVQEDIRHLKNIVRALTEEVYKEQK